MGYRITQGQPDGVAPSLAMKRNTQVKKKQKCIQVNEYTFPFRLLPVSRVSSVATTKLGFIPHRFGAHS